eukprot:gene20372-biopygen22111
MAGSPKQTKPATKLRKHCPPVSSPESLSVEREYPVELTGEWKIDGRVMGEGRKMTGVTGEGMDIGGRVTGEGGINE